MSRPLVLALALASVALPFVACTGDEDSTANPPDDTAGTAGVSGSSGQGGAGSSQGGAAGAGTAGTTAGSTDTIAGSSGDGGTAGTSAGTAGSAGDAGAAGTAGTAGTGGDGGTAGAAGSAGAAGGSAGTFSGGPYCGATKEELPSISKCDDPAPSTCAVAMCGVTGASAPKDCKQILLDCYNDANCNKTISCGGVCREQNPGVDPTNTCIGLAGTGVGKALAYKGCADKLTACGGDGTYDP